MTLNPTPWWLPAWFPNRRWSHAQVKLVAAHIEHASKRTDDAPSMATPPFLIGAVLLAAAMGFAAALSF